MRRNFSVEKNEVRYEMDIGTRGLREFGWRMEVIIEIPCLGESNGGV